jgi:uncharacterized protein (DUF427 family)
VAHPQRVEPGPGQESVWDYPRPPRVEPSKRTARVVFDDVEIARSDRALRVLETSGPPTYYIPLTDIASEHLEAVAGHSTVCEWKGTARYYDVVVGDRRAARAAWDYPDPKTAFTALRDHVAFYPGRVDACYLDDELVTPQPGEFYGGWITADIVGPFKGEPGTHGW